MAVISKPLLHISSTWGGRIKYWRLKNKLDTQHTCQYFMVGGTYIGNCLTRGASLVAPTIFSHLGNIVLGKLCGVMRSLIHVLQLVWLSTIHFTHYGKCQAPVVWLPTICASANQSSLGYPFELRIILCPWLLEAPELLAGISTTEETTKDIFIQTRRRWKTSKYTKWARW
jgi:hypothetical protein